MQFAELRRREFITLLGGAAAWPLVARAQQGERVRRIGVLAGGAAAGDRPEFAALQQALEQLGWSEGRNLRIEYRSGLGNPANIRKHADELVALAPDVILAAGASSLAPLLQATRELPIVFMSVVDPVGAGLVASLSRPGGERHRLHAIRIQLEWQVAAAAQGDRADSDAGGCAA